MDRHGVVGDALESRKIAVENPHPRSRDGGLVPLGEEDVALPQGRPPKGRATLGQWETEVDCMATTRGIDSDGASIDVWTPRWRKHLA